MEEEEQFESIDLNDDHICSVCKLETETGTLSFCHVCFELSMEGVSAAALLHSKSLRGHRGCFEKSHIIANQKPCCSRGGRSAYEGLKLAVSQRLNRLVRYTQTSVSAAGPSRQTASQTGGKRDSASDFQAPRYTRFREANAAEVLERRRAEELGRLRQPQAHVWSTDGGTGPQKPKPSAPGRRAERNPSREECKKKKDLEELRQARPQLLLQTQKVFEELTAAVQEKDSLLSELHVRHVAIEQLFQNCAKLPWLHISRAGAKA
ncbi:unnamed protein product, partial [Tetraodon nigroviridis]